MRAFESRQLVHAIVDASYGLEMIREFCRHQRGVTENVILDSVIDEHQPQHLTHNGVDGDLTSQSVRQVRHNDTHAPFGLTYIEAHRPVAEDWFFNKEDASFTGATG